MLCRVPWEFADKINQIVFKKKQGLQLPESVENDFHKYIYFQTTHNYLNESFGYLSIEIYSNALVSMDKDLERTYEN